LRGYIRQVDSAALKLRVNSEHSGWVYTFADVKTVIISMSKLRKDQPLKIVLDREVATSSLNAAREAVGETP
jgi:hypothetical protein